MTISTVHVLAGLVVLGLVVALMRWQGAGLGFSSLIRGVAVAAVGVFLLRLIA